MRLQPVRVLGFALLGLAATAATPTVASAQSVGRLYLSIDRSHILDIGDPARKIAVANPNIADVQVISPTQLLVVGKSAGITSLST